jgi:predicted nucleic acid-binding protein
VIWEAARRGEFTILTSTFSYIEVVYGLNEHGQPYSPEENDAKIYDMLGQSHVSRVQVDTEIAKLARALKRQFHPILRKRPDAVHLATAAYQNVEALHTYDGSDLLPLHGRVERRDGVMLDIVAAENETHGPLFAERRDDQIQAGNPNG